MCSKTEKERVIGEVCSIDATHEILLEYVAKSANNINLIISPARKNYFYFVKYTAAGYGISILEVMRQIVYGYNNKLRLQVKTLHSGIK